MVSNTLTKPEWKNSVVINGDVVKKVKKLKKQSGPDLKVYGSSTLTQTLFQHDLVAELWLKILPTTLGSGKRLFAEGTIPTPFKLIDGKISPTGVIIANYARAGKVKTGSFL